MLGETSSPRSQAGRTQGTKQVEQGTERREGPSVALCTSVPSLIFGSLTGGPRIKFQLYVTSGIVPNSPFPHL